jgi:putative two-component system response regulator
MKILLVDDNPVDLAFLERLLMREGYEIIKANDGMTALSILEREEIDLIILDVIMPGISGFDVARRIKKGMRLPVVLLSGLSPHECTLRGLESGADEIVAKPFVAQELQLRIRNLLKMKAYQNTLEETVTRRSVDLKRIFRESNKLTREMVFRLLMAAECRDDGTGKHIARVGKYAGIIAKHYGIDEESVELIEDAAPMHDIGKIGIPDKILLKPGRLSDEEFEIMKRHPLIGSEILRKSSFALLKMSFDITLTHHERWDGSGYPFGLRENDIPVAGRIAALSDVFDALTSRRPYKPPYSWGKSVSIVHEERGKHFDPRVVDAFLNGLEEIRTVYREQQDSGISDTTEVISDLRNRC